jgi:CDGSH-type Zn-finger protein
VQTWRLLVWKPGAYSTREGLYRVTGGFELTGTGGSDAVRNAGASREHYALCRCGHSQNKPFCSGMHWYVDFRDLVADPAREPTLFERAGALPALTRMARLFCEKLVPADPLLAPLFADMPPGHPEQVAARLGEVFGGPEAGSHQDGAYPRMMDPPLGKDLTDDHRARWVAPDQPVSFAGHIKSLFRERDRKSMSLPSTCGPMPPSRPAPEAVEQPALRTPWSPAPQHVGSLPSTPGAGYLHRIATAVLRT